MMARHVGRWRARWIWLTLILVLQVRCGGDGGDILLSILKHDHVEGLRTLVARAHVMELGSDLVLEDKTSVSDETFTSPCLIRLGIKASEKHLVNISILGLDEHGVVIAQGVVALRSLVDDVKVSVLLRAIPSGCDKDGDGYLECTGTTCCWALEVNGLVGGFADCDDGDPRAHPFAETPACRACEDSCGELAPDVREQDVDVSAQDVEVRESVEQQDALDVQGGDSSCDAPAGRFLCPCQWNADCGDGLCIDTEGHGKVCTVPCQQECPDPTWLCISFTASGLKRVCVPPETTICDACEEDSGCYNGLGVCALVGTTGLSYCTRRCGTGCPEGFACEFDREDEQNRCYPLTGSCECNSLINEMERACSVSNEAGECFGVEVCQGGDGWTECSAPEPVTESCDGVDNDCDEEVDEGFDDTDDDGIADCMDPDDDNDGVEDALDNCRLANNPAQDDFDEDGSGDVCDPDDDDDGSADELDCGPFDDEVSPDMTEVCDQKDNDCSGVIDDGLCDDGNLCTDDICHPEGGCSHPANTNPCDDQNVCTQTDVCVQGVCIGNAPLDCHDGDDCTIDRCDPAAGCYYMQAG